jgi:hypothetical protein
MEKNTDKCNDKLHLPVFAFVGERFFVWLGRLHLPQRATRHQHAELFAGGSLRVDGRDDLAAMHCRAVYCFS